MTTRNEAVDPINRSVARLLRLNASRAAFARSASAAGTTLSHPAYLLLRAAIESGPLSMGELAEDVAMDVGQATRHVARLVDDSLLDRQRDPADGRRSLVSATRSGRRAGNSMHAVRLQHLTESLAAWPMRDLRELDRLLARFVDDLVATSYHSATTQD